MPPWWRKEDREWVVPYTAVAVIEDTSKKVVAALKSDPFTFDASGFAAFGLLKLESLRSHIDRVVLDVALEYGIIGPGEVWP